jgi:hypothetical protein
MTFFYGNGIYFGTCQWLAADVLVFKLLLYKHYILLSFYDPRANPQIPKSTSTRPRIMARQTPYNLSNATPCHAMQLSSQGDPM